MSVLAIDAGTTGVTAVVVTPEGVIAAKGYQEFAQHFPRPGWVEHSPEEIWQATIEATRSVLAAHDRDDLTAIGITNQRETVLLWDRETLGSPRRAIVWQDRRTAEICNRLRDAGHEDRVAELTGLREVLAELLVAGGLDLPVGGDHDGGHACRTGVDREDAHAVPSSPRMIARIRRSIHSGRAPGPTRIS